MDTKRSPALLSILLLALLAAPPDRSLARSPAARRDTVLLLHTNDLHSHLLPDVRGRGGLARIAGWVEAARKRRKDVLFLDAGDGVTGTPVSSIFKGRPIFFVMNAMGYDAMALGNHEFDHGWERIADYRRIARFPLLAANARDRKGRLLADAATRVFDVDGVRVGVIGVVTERTPALTVKGATEGVEFSPPAAAVRALLPGIEERADLVVVLSHLGHPEDLRLAAEVPGIDVIVGGHSHTVVPRPVRVGSTLVAQAGCYGRYLGRLDLGVDLEKGTVISCEGDLLPVDGRCSPSAAVAKAVDVWERAVAKRVDVEIGRAAKPRSREELKGDLEAIFREVLGTDLAFQNPGGVRADLPAGPITIRRIWTILPFENTLVTVRVRGAKLPDWARRRLGDPDPARIYTVATNSYVAGHLDRYFPAGVEGLVESGLPLRAAVIDWYRGARRGPR